MNAMTRARRWTIRIGGLSLAILITTMMMTMTMTAARAQTSTTSSPFMVTANVINSCSFDSTTSQTLAITCSTQTPVAASSTGTPASSAAPVAQSSTVSNGASVRLPTTKLCNFLAIARLENASFNQYSLDITQMTTGPQRYYSTMQVCF